MLVTGLYLLLISSRPSFLIKGVMIAFLSTLGTSPICSEIFIILVSGGNISWMHSLIKLVGIGSSLQYLLGD